MKSLVKTTVTKRSSRSLPKNLVKSTSARRIYYGPRVVSAITHNLGSDNGDPMNNSLHIMFGKPSVVLFKVADETVDDTYRTTQKVCHLVNTYTN